MQGNIITVDYAETNGYLKHYSIVYYEKPNSFDDDSSLYVKTIRAKIDFDKGMGSAGQSRKKRQYPGNDPNKSPGKNFEWRGKGDPSSGKGAWVNTKTGETLHPDLNHGAPYGPHWDYNYPGGGAGFRLYPDGSMIPKMFMGGI